MPFLEYELHRQLLTKLKIKGMNGLFNISIQSMSLPMTLTLVHASLRCSFLWRKHASCGGNWYRFVCPFICSSQESSFTLLLLGAFLSPLLPPTPPKISSGKGILCSKLNEIQALISESIDRNRELYKLNQKPLNSTKIEENKPDTNKSEENFEKYLNNHKESCVLLEVDDTEDADIISLMIDSDVPKGFDICNSEILPGKERQFMSNLQMFAQVYRAKLTSLKQFGHQFDWIIQVVFKIQVLFLM